MKRGVAAWGLWASACMFFIAAAARAGTDDLENAVRQAYPTNEGLLTQTTSSAVARLFLGFKVPDGSSLRLEPASENRANWFVETHLLSYLSEAGYSAYLAKPHSRMPEESPPGPDAGARPVPKKSHAQAGSLSAAVGSSPELAKKANQGDSTLATATDSLTTSPDTLVSPPSAPPPQPSEVDTSTPLPILEGEEADYVLRYRVVLCELSYPEKHRSSPLGSSKVERRASVSLVAQLMQGPRQDVVWVGKGNAEQVSMVPAGKLNYLAGTDFPFNPPPLEQKGMGGYVEPMLVTGIVAGLIYLFYANQN